MKKKNKILLITVIVAVLVVPFSVFAATSDTPAAKSVRNFFGLDYSKLTDQQKAIVKDYNQKLADLQKDFINKMVDNGAITKEQGDAASQKIDEALKDSEGNGFIFGFGMKRGGFGDYGMHEGIPGLGKIDLSKLTDQQKTDILDSIKKMADLQKDLVNKMVSDNLLTKEQGDSAIKKIDEIINSIQQNGIDSIQKDGLFKGLGVCMDGFGFIGMGGISLSNLTDQQKADLTDYVKKMADLQKELVSKMVADGLLTKEQGDTITQAIDNRVKNIEENGFPNKMGIGKGHFGNHGPRGNYKNDNDDEKNDNDNENMNESTATKSTT